MMRYSFIKGRPGHDELKALFADGKTLRVFFRGREVKCLEADDVEGTIVLPLVRDKKVIGQKKLQGKVRFET